MDGVMDYTGVKTVKKGTIAVAVHGYSIGLTQNHSGIGSDVSIALSTIEVGRICQNV